MPVYVYECQKCGAEQDAYRSVDDRHKSPMCCKKPTKLLITAVMGFVDFPAAGGRGYVSTTTGKYIETSRARKDDLKRSGCRPWEGMEQEKKEAARQKKYREEKSDKKLDEAVRRSYSQLAPSKRRQLEGT